MIVSVLPACQFLVKAGVGRHIDLTSQNRIDSLRLCGAVKINGAVHYAVVRYGCAVHAQLLYPCHIFLYFVGTVQQRIFRVDVKMNKCHDEGSLSCLSNCL